MDEILERIISGVSVYEAIALMMLVGMAKALVALWDRAKKLEDRSYTLLTSMLDDKERDDR